MITLRISQIFRILIDNAIKYSLINSEVSITATNHYKGKYNQKRIDAVLFQIKDFGIGIHKEDIPNLFKRFYRAKSAEGISGTGLGLYLAKDLVYLHKGNIFVESEYQKGSTFFIFLPYLKPNDF